MIYFFDFPALALAASMRTFRSFFNTLTEPSGLVLFLRVLYAAVSNLLRCFLAWRNLKRSKSFNETRCENKNETKSN